MKSQRQIIASTNVYISINTIVFIFILFFSSALKAQYSPAWVNFSSPANYANYDVKEVSVGVDTLGNVYTGASMSDTLNNLSKAMLVKYNSAGAQQWIRYYDSNNSGYNGSYVVTVLVDKAGNSYLCGYGKSNSTSGNDFMLVKYDNAGNQQWVKYWDGGQNNYDYATCAAFDATGNIVVAGYANNFGTAGDDIAVVKWTTSGVQVWSYVYNNASSNGEDRALSVASDAGGNIFVTGSTYGTNARNMITIKLNSSGLNQWTKILPHVISGADEHGYGVTADAFGNSYATGAAGDWITIKYDPSGTVLWTNHYVANGLVDDIKKIMLDKYNNVIVTGGAFFNGGNFSDLVVNKINNVSGNSLWSINYNNAGIDNFMDAAVDTSGNIYVGGFFEGPLGADLSALVVSPGGIILWHSTYTNPIHASGGDEPYHIAIDKNRNFILAGLSERRGSGSVDGVDVVTLKYSALVTAINEHHLTQTFISVDPNPATNQLNIHTQNSEMIGSLITITNSLGQLVKQTQLNNNDQQIDLNGMLKGIYFITVMNSKSTANAKIILE